MRSSIKKFLLCYLLLSITIVASLTAVGNYFLDRNAIEKQFDNQLQQASYFIRGLLSADAAPQYLKILKENVFDTPNISPSGSLENSKISPALYHLQFRIWDSNGNQILETANMPKFNNIKKISNGYHTIKAGEYEWRVFKEGPVKDSNLTVLVAELYDIRDELQHKMTWGNVLMLFWTFPLIGLLVWLIVDKGLRSLQNITYELGKRKSTQLNIVENHNIPVEVRPLVDALNSLFMRLQESFERNKRFSGDAAHELRTPLAALKTQAQVALQANSDEDRRETLQNVISGVDRCTHVVQQLLTLSRLGPEATLNDIAKFDLTKLAAEMIAQLVPHALDKNIEIELKQPSGQVFVYGNETSISILIRNLVDNAIRYTPEGGEVHVCVFEKKGKPILQVLDSGRGIPKELRSRVFERFYRVLGTKQQGSGLGLAIVRQIVSLHHAKIALDDGIDGKGLGITVTFNDKVLRKEAKLLK